MIFYVLIITVCISLMAKVLAFKVFKPVSSKEFKRYNTFTTNEVKQEMTFEDLRDMMAEKIRAIMVSDEFEETLKVDINRLGLNIRPVDIRKYQTLYLLLGLGTSAILYFFTPILGVVSIVFTIYAWKHPIQSIKKEIKIRNLEIEECLPDFYSMVYSTYVRTTQTDLGSLIIAFLPNATPLFEEELKIILDDIRYAGEQFALKQFKKRAPLAIVTRFCEIMESRLHGHDNTSVMTNFKLEMVQKLEQLVDKKAEKRLKQAKNISYLLAIPLTLILLTYFGMQINASLNF